MRVFRLYNPQTLVRAVVADGLTTKSTDMDRLYDLACEIHDDTADWWSEGEGFGSSDIFGDVCRLARELGYKYDRGGWVLLGEINL